MTFNSSSLSASRDNNRTKKATSFMSTPPKSLLKKIAESQIRYSNEEYQHQLISTKQLEIKLLQKQQEYDEIMRQHKKKRKKVTDLEIQVKKYQNQSMKKKQYLEKFYNYLDSKLKKGKDNLFSRLQKLQQILIEKYETQKINIESNFSSELEELKQSKRLKFLKKEKKNQLLKHFNHQLRKSQEMNNAREKLKRQKQSTLHQFKVQSQFFKTQIQKLCQTKVKFQENEKSLKKILNIDQEHKKYSLQIMKGMKKQFSIKLKQNKYKEGVCEEYQKNMEGLKGIIQSRRKVMTGMQQNLSETSRKLNKLKSEISEKGNHYSSLEDEIIKRQK